MYSKYFIALVPPEPILSQVLELKKNLFDIYKIKGALRSPAHITLHMPFTWKEEKEDFLISTLEKFKSSKNVEIELNNYDCFEPRVIYIACKENQELNKLQQELVIFCKKNLQLFNQAEDMRGFHPHITIAFRDLKKPLFYKIWEEYKDKNYSSSFITNKISLLKQLDNKWEIYKEFEY